MSKLTWADVAPYYAKNNPSPLVWVVPRHEHKAGLFECNTQYFLHKAYAEDLPILAELSEITEEDARGVLDACGVSLEGVSVTALRFLNESMVDAKVGDNHTVLTLALGRPEVFHYLISRNYNVFGIETWKGVQP